MSNETEDANAESVSSSASCAEAEPTPGPWELTRTHSGAGEIVVGGSTGFVATPWRTPKGEAQMMANARLIAAAGTAAQEAKEMGYDPVAAVEALPELLKACQKSVEGMPLASQQAQNALASAEGCDDE